MPPPPGGRGLGFIYLCRCAHAWEMPLCLILALYTFLCPIYPDAKLDRSHDACVLVPAQHRVLAASRPRVLDVGPAPEEILLGEHPGRSARHRMVDVLHQGEVGGEEDVEIALQDLSEKAKSGWSVREPMMIKGILKRDAVGGGRKGERLKWRTGLREAW